MILFHNVHRLKITKIKFCKNNSIQKKHRVLEDFQLLPIIVENHLTNVGKLPTNPQILALAHHRNSSEVTTANLDSKSVFRPELKQRSSWNILTFFRDLLRTWFAMQGELNPYMIYHFQSEKPTMQAQHFFVSHSGSSWSSWSSSSTWRTLQELDLLKTSSIWLGHLSPSCWKQ